MRCMQVGVLGQEPGAVEDLITKVSLYELLTAHGYPINSRKDLILHDVPGGRYGKFAVRTVHDPDSSTGPSIQVVQVLSQLTLDASAPLVVGSDRQLLPRDFFEESESYIPKGAADYLYLGILNGPRFVGELRPVLLDDFVRGGWTVLAPGGAKMARSKYPLAGFYGSNITMSDLYKELEKLKARVQLITKTPEFRSKEYLESVIIVGEIAVKRKRHIRQLMTIIYDSGKMSASLFSTLRGDLNKLSGEAAEMVDKARWLKDEAGPVEAAWSLLLSLGKSIFDAFAQMISSLVEFIFLRVEPPVKSLCRIVEWVKSAERFVANNARLPEQPREVRAYVAQTEYTLIRVRSHLAALDKKLKTMDYSVEEVCKEGLPLTGFSGLGGGMGSIALKVLISILTLIILAIGFIAVPLIIWLSPKPFWIVHDERNESVWLAGVQFDLQEKQSKKEFWRSRQLIALQDAFARRQGLTSYIQQRYLLYLQDQKMTGDAAKAIEDIKEDFAKEHQQVVSALAPFATLTPEQTAQFLRERAIKSRNGILQFEGEMNLAPTIPFVKTAPKEKGGGKKESAWPLLVGGGLFAWFIFG